jgi:TRAP-type mannitol/chloroaromatic compound transport system permease small subunit
MGLLLRLSRAVDWASDLIGRAVMWLILLAVLVSAGNAIMRKAFNMSSNAWLELQWYLFGAAFMGAAAYTLKQGEHIRIDIVYAARSRRTQHWIDLLGHLVFLMPFCLISTWMLVPYFLNAWASGQISTNSGGLIIWPARAILLAGFALLCLQGLSEIVKKIAVMRGLIEDPVPYVSALEAAEAESKSLAAEIAK